VNSARNDPGPWYGNDRERVRFEGAARLVIDGLRVTTGGGRAYYLTLDVPHYDERRHVTITFKQQNPRIPTITVDGPPRITAPLRRRRALHLGSPGPNQRALAV
jgi:hypothetical protein